MLLATDFVSWAEALAQITHDCSDTEKHALWRGTARAFYKLPKTPAAGA
jgi:predicted TIM-barrel fold metal-dependent hydrolase